ncbi:unnamed protein product [Malus baccata var. baccata]
MGAFGTRTGRDGTGRNEGVIFEKDMGYICLKMVKHCVPQTWNKPVPGGEVERKNTQNLSRGTTRAKMPFDRNKEKEEGDGYVIILSRSIRFRRTKREIKHLVPFRSISPHVPNGT